MKRRDYNAFISDLHRYRPVIVVVLSVLVLLPTLDEMVTQGLSMLVVLLHLAEAMFFDGILVWLVSSVFLHYARIQARVEMANDREREFQA